MTLWIGNDAVLKSSSQWQLTFSYTTNFRPFKIERVFKTEIWNLMKIAETSSNE